MIQWDGYTFTEKQVNDWMANVREILEILQAGGGGGGTMTAAQLLALIEDTATVTAALNGTGTKIQLTATATSSWPPVPYPTPDDGKTYCLQYLNDNTHTLAWVEVIP